MDGTVLQSCASRCICSTDGSLPAWQPGLSACWQIKSGSIQARLLIWPLISR